MPTSQHFIGLLDTVRLLTLATLVARRDLPIIVNENISGTSRQRNVYEHQRRSNIQMEMKPTGIVIF
jgi:hypothetical protein